MGIGWGCAARLGYGKWVAAKTQSITDQPTPMKVMSNDWEQAN